MFNRRVFRATAGLGVGSIGAMSVLFFGAQQAFPFFIGNVGTFMVTSDSIEAEDFQLVLGVDENSAENGGALPTGEIVLGDATLEGLVVEKAVNVSSVIGNVAQPEWKLRLSSTQPVNLANTRINTVGLCAENFTANDLEIDGKGADTPTFVDDFVLASRTVTLTGVGIEASYLAAGTLSIQGLTGVVEPGGYDKAACLP